MATQFNDSLLKDLLESGIITKEVYRQVIEEQRNNGGYLCEIVVNLGYATEKDLLGCFSQRHGVAAVSLDHINIDAEIFEMIPETTASYYHAVPISKFNDNLVVAIVDPLNIFALDDLGLITQMKITAVAVLASEVERALELHYHKFSHVKASDLLNSHDLRDLPF